MKSFTEIGTEIGALVTKKNAAYGNSFEESAKILQILFPDGVKPENYRNLLTITRVLDKLFRIATDEKALEENPWRDIAGYSLLSIRADLKLGEEK